MENASKALVMAGAILLSVMIISLAILIFNRMGGTAKKMANMDEQEVAAFNAKITPYLGASISGSQVNALLQYCLSVNIASKNSGETFKQITIYNDGDATSLDPDETTFTKVETKQKYYTVKGTYNDYGLLTTLNIKRN